jgi:predicted phosphodiesterase
MRFAILGDIHANIHALAAVLEDAEDHSCNQYVCLGDIVGYNAYPSECVDVIRDLDCPVVKGNHDEQVSMDVTQGGLNPLAEAAILWTQEQLDSDQLQWLKDLRMQRQVRDFSIVHATLDTPQKWGYITTQLDAAASFSYQITNLCFIGHTHVPKAYIKEEIVRTEILDVLPIEKKKKYLINVGSVGQPRDGDWRASYCIYDSESSEVTLRRVDYDIQSAQNAILAAGLPQKLATRLASGR